MADLSNLLALLGQRKKEWGMEEAPIPQDNLPDNFNPPARTDIPMATETPIPSPVTSQDIPKQVTQDELRNMLFQRLQSRLGGADSQAQAIREAQERAKPSMWQALGLGLANGLTAASGRTPQYSVMDMYNARLKNEMAPIEAQKKSELEDIDTLKTLANMGDQDAQRKLAEQKFGFEKEKFEAEKPTREMELKYKSKMMEGMSFENARKQIENQDAQALSDPNSDASKLYKSDFISSKLREFKMQNPNATPQEIEKKQMLLEALSPKLSAAQLKTMGYSPKELGGSQGGLTATETLKVAEGKVIPDTLRRLEEDIEKNKHMFASTSFKPWAKASAAVRTNIGEEEQIFDAKIRADSQQFGRFMEGGVLRKEDEEKYRLMFPQMSDTPTVAKEKLKNVREMMERKYQSDLAALQAQGKSTAGLALPKQSASFPKQLRKDGKVVTVSNEQELKEAQAEGWQ